MPFACSSAVSCRLFCTCGAIGEVAVPTCFCRCVFALSDGITTFRMSLIGPSNIQSRTLSLVLWHVKVFDPGFQSQHARAVTVFSFTPSDVFDFLVLFRDAMENKHMNFDLVA